MAETPNDPYAVVNRNTGLYDLVTNPDTYNLEGFHPASGDGGKDCNDYAAWGNGSTIYSYIVKSNANPDTYPEAACDPYYHQTGQIDNLRVNVNIQGPNGTGAFGINSTLVTFSGDVSVVGVITSYGYGWSIGAGGYDGPVSGSVSGDVTGNLTGDVTGDVIGNVTGNVTGTATTATTASSLSAGSSIDVDTSSNPAGNKQITFNFVNNTTLRIKMTNAEGTVSSVDLTLS